MRLSTILALFVTFSSAFASLIARQSLPNCAISCLANANYGNCSSTDNNCLCHSQAFVNSTTTCIQSSCTGSDLTSAEAASQQLCAAVGVTLTTLPSSTSSSSSSSKTSSVTSSVSVTPMSNAASSKNINVLTGAAALAILAASF